MARHQGVAALVAGLKTQKKTCNERGNVDDGGRMNIVMQFDPAQGTLPFGSVHPTCAGSFFIKENDHEQMVKRVQGFTVAAETP